MSWSDIPAEYGIDPIDVDDWREALCVIIGMTRSAMSMACPPTGIRAADQSAYEYGYYAGMNSLANQLYRKVKNENSNGRAAR